MTLIIYVVALLFFVAIGTPISFALLGCALSLMVHLGMTDPQIVDEIFESLQALARTGVTLLLVEQFVTRQENEVFAENFARHAVGTAVVASIRQGVNDNNDAMFEYL